MVPNISRTQNTLLGLSDICSRSAHLSVLRPYVLDIQEKQQKISKVVFARKSIITIFSINHFHSSYRNDGLQRALQILVTNMDNISCTNIRMELDMYMKTSLNKMARERLLRLQKELHEIKNKIDQLKVLKIKRAQLLCQSHSSIEDENKEFFSLIFCGICAAFTAAIHPIFILGLGVGYHFNRKSRQTKILYNQASMMLKDVNEEIGIVNSQILKMLSKFKYNIERFQQQVSLLNGKN